MMHQSTRHRHSLIATILTTVTIIMLAAPTHALTLTTTQCASWLYNMTVTDLEPGWYYYYNLTVPASSVTLTIQANVVSSVPVEVAIFTPNGQEVWSTQPSTILMGTYTVTLGGSSTYQIAVYNPSSNTESANTYGWYNVTMCGPGATQTWLSQFTQLWPTDVVSNGVNLTMAPMGIVAYGVIEAGGQSYAYTLTTDAVEGVVYIPSTVSASDYYPDGTYYGNAFTVQLNAYVVAELANGQTQYYWVQNAAEFNNGQLWVDDNVWNDTTYISHLSSSAIQGNGAVYYYTAGEYFYYYKMPNPIPFGQATLEISAQASGGSIIIYFYADGQNYDTVTITPSTPATSASIVIAPTLTPAMTPLDLELVLGGKNGGVPYAVLQGGSISMSLYVDENGHWVPPPSAWTVGISTYEKSYSHVVPNGVGSAVVEPGAPDVEELWGGTVIATPLGDYVTTSTDLTQYASQYFPQVVSPGNGTRFVLEGVVVNGQPASLNALSYVPLGSLVLANYATQYLVSIYAPTNTTTTWVDAGTPILIDEPLVINFGNGTRLINPTLSGGSLPVTIEVNMPLEFTVTYTKQYLVTQTSIFGTQSKWVNAGAQYVLNKSAYTIIGVLFTPVGILVNGVYKPFTAVTVLSVSEPMNITIIYQATANVSTTAWGMPALYASATMTCGQKVVTATGYLTSKLTVSMPNPPTYECTITTSTTPLSPFLAIIVAVIAIAFILITRRGRRKKGVYEEL